MNRDEVIRIVRASAVEIYGPMPDEKMYDIFIERCARLIDMGCADAIASEREKCAKVCDFAADEFMSERAYMAVAGAEECAAAIRAR